MKTLLKIVAWIAGGLVLLVAGLAVFVTLVIDPNEYKPQIASLVEEQIGRKLTIDGDLELTFFPWLGVRTENVSLSNPPGFGDAHMLTVTQVEVRARLMPLLSKQFEADTIVLREPSVHLIVDADGVNNWQDLAQPASETAPEQPADPGAAMAALAVQGVDLKGGSLIWEDRQAGSKYVVDNIDIDVGEVLSQNPVDLTLSLTLGSDALEHAIDIEVESQVTLSLSDSSLTLSNARVRSKYGAEAELDALLGNMVYEINASRARLQDLAMDVKYTGPGAGQALSATVKTGLTANIESGLVEVGNTAVDMRYGEAGKATGGFESLSYDMNVGTLRSDTFSLSGGYTDQALEHPATAEIYARITADLAGQTMEMHDGLLSVDYGPGSKADARFESMRYDLAESNAGISNLDLSGTYTDAGLPQTVAFKMRSDVAISLDDGLASLAGPDIHVEYGELGLADIKADTIDYRMDSSVVDVSRAVLTGTYSGPEIAQPLAIDFNGDLSLNTSTLVAEITEAKATAGYGAEGSADIAIGNLVYRMADSTLDISQTEIAGRYAGKELEQPVEAEFSGGIKVNIAEMITEVANVEGSATFGPLGQVGIKTGLLRYDQGRNLVDARAMLLDGTWEIHEFRAAFSELTADINGQKLDAPDFDIHVDGVPAKGNLSVSNFLGDVAFSGDLQTGDFKPSAVIDKLGIDFTPADPKALASAALSMKFTGALDRVRLDELSARLDETNLSGFIEVASFSRPEYRFEIDVDGIDVDRYAPTGNGAAQSDAGAAMVVLPVGLFRGLKADGALRVGNLRASGVNATDINIGVASTEQDLTVKPISASLYGGSLEGDMHFTEKEGVARLQIRQVMDQVEVGSLLADTGVTDRISGKGRLEMDVVAIEVGGKPQTLGKAGFHFFDGAIKGLNLRKIYLQAREIYNQRKGREEEVESDDSEEFRFTEMTGTLEFDERTATNDDLEIKSPLFRINGRGKADLAADLIDYLLLATVVESAKGQGGEELTELRGVTLPVRISGSLNSPVYTLDVATILKLALQSRIEKEVEEKLGDELKDQLGDGLKKLLKIN